MVLKNSLRNMKLLSILEYVMEYCLLDFFTTVAVQEKN